MIPKCQSVIYIQSLENKHLLLQRMRSLPDGWTGATMAMHDKYKTRIKLADQDILNILFRFLFFERWYIAMEIHSSTRGLFSNHIQSSLSIRDTQCETSRE